MTCPQTKAPYDDFCPDHTTITLLPFEVCRWECVNLSIRNLLFLIVLTFIYSSMFGFVSFRFISSTTFIPMNSASYSSYSASTCCRLVLSIFLLLIFDWGLQNCDGFGTFGFDIHHRFSDPVKGILSFDELPEQGSLDYYVAMAHRDRIIHGRRLATTNNRNQTLLTFYNSNMTYGIRSLG